MIDEATISADAADRGKAAGSWVIDGNTTRETCEHIVRMYDDGDPEVYDIEPSPLSGEWAGESIPELIAGYNDMSADEQDAACGVYEQAFSQAFWDEVLRSARYQLS